jgi:CHAT domain-containing protein/type II secretory pathway pseudopilin PulG
VKNLALAYINRIRGERAENLEQAIALFQHALQVYTREQFPVHWALTVNNLALAYSNRICGERAENLEQAIALFQQALQVYTRENFPGQCYGIGQDLGHLGFSAGNWEVAIEGYAIAIEALERSRSWATNETSRQEIHAGAANVYAQLVQACINAGRLNLALETVERSRSKRLVEMMSINDFYQDRDTPAQVQSYLQAYETLQRQIDNLRLDLKMVSESKPVGAERSMRSRAALSAVDQHIQELEQQKQMMRQQISRLDPVSAGLLEVNALNLTEIQQLIERPNTALLSFYMTAKATHIFVLRQNQLTYHPCPEQGDALAVWLDQWLRAYLGIRLTDDGAIQRLPRSSWKSNLPGLLAELSQRLEIEDLIQNHLQAIDELILVPHFQLHQIPFAALPTSQGLLGDRFTLRVVPSCQVLQFCHQRPPLTPDLLGLIEDASGDLPCSTFEAESVATLYNVSPELRLRGPGEATVDKYKRLLQEQQIQMLLSCHHAQSRLDNPLESKLLLADGDITLGELLSPAWRLPQLADVFLSCCETGLGASLDLTDDVLTLAAGFLCAGARSVISTLWSVDDLATAIFSIFYHQNRHKTHGNMNRPQALQRAQQTLREMTGSTLDQTYRPKLEAILEVKYDKADNNRRQATTDRERNYWAGIAIGIGDTLERLDELCEQPYPFEHPIYWAGFVCHGLR